MRKIILILTVFLIVITTYMKAQTYSPVYTPKGTEVSAWITSELSENDRVYWDSYFSSHYPNATQLYTYGNYSSTGRFNCHGYAWYMSENDNELANPRWIGLGYNEPSNPEYNYWQDGSYIEVNSSNIFPSKVNWSNGDHSAITTNVEGELISKWRFYPFMQHQWNDSPYGSSGLKYYIRPVISGTTSLCYTGSSFSISNIPSNATISWSTSSNIKRISSQGANPCNFRASSSFVSGDGSINATVIVNGNSLNISKDVYVGTPKPSIILCTSPTSSSHLAYGFTGTTYWLHPYETNLSDNNSDYKWLFYSSDPFSLPVQAIGKSIPFRRTTAGDYKVSLKYNGKCGWCSKSFETIRIIGNPIYNILLTPNPAKGTTIVSLEEDVSSNLMMNSLSMDKNLMTKKPTEIEIQLWNIYGKLKTYKAKSEKYQISLAGLSSGIYYVIVIKDKNIYRKQLIIE